MFANSKSGRFFLSPRSGRTAGALRVSAGAERCFARSQSVHTPKAVSRCRACRGWQALKPETIFALVTADRLQFFDLPETALVERDSTFL